MSESGQPAKLQPKYPKTCFMCDADVESKHVCPKCAPYVRGMIDTCNVSRTASDRTIHTAKEAAPGEPLRGTGRDDYKLF